MRTIVTALMLLGLGVSGGAAADCGDAPKGAQTFVRSHRVHNFNGEPPSNVDDELAIWQKQDGGNCVQLTTVGPNGHECDVLGSAFRIGRNKMEFRDASCTITFQKSGGTIAITVSLGWERLGRGGTCTKNRCGMYGEVTSGTFRAKR